MRKAANDDDSAWEAVNESTSVNGTNKGMSRGEAEVANTNATEVAATTETAAKAAVPTSRHRCLIGARKIDTRKPGRARLDCSERQNRERQRRPTKLMLEHWTLRVLRQQPPYPHGGVGAIRKRRIRMGLRGSWRLHQTAPRAIRLQRELFRLDRVPKQVCTENTAEVPSSCIPRAMAPADQRPATRLSDASR